MEIIGQIYEALGDEEAFSCMPGLVAKAVGARSATFMSHTPDMVLEEICTHYFSKEMTDFYAEHQLDRFDSWWHTVAKAAQGGNHTIRAGDYQSPGALLGVNQIEDAYLVLAADRRISFANAAADALLSNSGLLEPVQGRLYLHRPQDDQKLVCALDDANQNHRSGRLSFLGQDKSGATWRFTLAPKAFEGETRVLVWIDRCRASASAPEAMQQIYGLTEAELPILMAVSQGMSAAEISALHRISIATVRTHIQHIYQKTGVKKASQLATLVSTLPKVR